jgi:hypothetical protein
MKIKLLSSEAACGTSTTNGSNFGLSSAVRVHNSGASARVVTVETVANVTIGTFTLGVGSSEVVNKNPKDEVYAAHAEVLGVGVAQIG